MAELVKGEKRFCRAKPFSKPHSHTKVVGDIVILIFYIYDQLVYDNYDYIHNWLIN